MPMPGGDTGSEPAGRRRRGVESYTTGLRLTASTASHEYAVGKCAQCEP